MEGMSASSSWLLCLGGSLGKNLNSRSSPENGVVFSE